ncbi:MAG: hypothetical protein ACF8XB_20470 [Planctomycetota bacterium JB042]
MNRVLFPLVSLSALVLGASGCRLAPPAESTPAYPAAPDPNERFAVEREAAPLQQQAKTTLLEENEKLRDMVGRTLSEKRAVERELEKARIAAEDLDDRATQQQDAIQALTDQVQDLTERLATAERRADALDKERKALAEMFADEKRQRLAFEKEILEREIAERTFAKDRQ